MSRFKPMFRSWRNHRSLVLQVIIILALGIGANVAVFTFFDHVLLDLPFEDPGRLVTLWEVNPRQGAGQTLISASDFADIEQQCQSLESASLYDSDSGVLQSADYPEKIPIASVSPNFFSTLQARALLGRVFTAEDRPGSMNVIIGHRAWTQIFHSDPLIVDKAVQVDDKIYTVVGVLPENFRLFEEVALWTPVRASDDDMARGARHYLAIGRLKIGHHLENARTELNVIAKRLQKQFPDTNAGWEISAAGLRDYLFKDLKSGFILIALTAGLVLIIACFNVTNLLLLYLHSKQREVAVQLALGCSQKRIRSYFLLEFGFLALVSGIAGLMVGNGIGHWVLRYAPKAVVRGGVAIDLRVYLFCFGCTTVSSLIPSLLSLLWKSDRDISDTLKGTGSGLSVASTRRNTPRKLLLVFEIGMSVILLVSAGVMAKSFLLLQRINPGFEPQHLLTSRILLPPSRYKTKPQQALFFDQLRQNLQAMPNVSGVAAVTGIPLGGSRMSFRFWRPDQSSAKPATEGTEYRAISPNYFRVLGIQVLEGHEFSEFDKADALPVVAINEAIRRRFFAGEDPIGKHLAITFGDQRPLTIVAVVKDVKYSALTENTKYEVYVPYLQNPWPFMSIVLQTMQSPQAMISTLRQQVKMLDRDLPVQDIRTMDQIVYDSLSETRFATILMLAFSVLALVLSSIGMYSVMSFAVSQNMREIGIRMAVGAPRSSILALFMLQGLFLITVGVVAGFVASIFTSGLLKRLLYRVQPVDFQVDLLIIAFLVAVGMAACLIPARRASKVDPIIVLRNE